MGLVRFMLALCVIAGHSSPILGLRLLPPEFAVSCFFVISGFYIQMILGTKYDRVGGVKIFYLNRFLRLYPTYLLIFSAAWLWVAWHFWRHEALPIQKWVSGYAVLGGLDGLVAMVCNISLVGLDVLSNLSWSSGGGWHFSPKMEAIAAGMWGGELLTLAPAWSISLEIWFYLVAPLLARLRSRWLLLTGGMSCALYTTDILGKWVDGERCLPCQFWCFATGMLLWRFRSLFHGVMPSASLRAALVSAFLMLAVLVDIHSSRMLQSMMMLMLCLLIPVAFELTKNSRWDRLVGNLSYPAYLVHWPVCFLLRSFNGGHVPGWQAAFFTLPVSMLVYQLVEAPVDVLRQSLAKKARKA